MEAASHPWPTLGVLLLRDGLVTREDLESVLLAQQDSRRQRVTGSRLGELLVERGLVTREQVAKLVAEQYELPFIELSEADVEPSVARRLRERLARDFQALPLNELPGGSLLVAIADPATVLFAEDLREALGAPLRFAVVPPDAMEAAIARVYQDAPVSLPFAEPEEPTDEDLRRIEAEAEEASPDDRYLGSPRAVAQLWPPLGALLIREGLITDEELDAALAQQRLSGGKRLGELLVERGAVTRGDIARLLAEQYELPFVELVPAEVDQHAAVLLPEDLAHRYSALPVGFDPDGTLQIAIADPVAVLYCDELRETLRVPVRFAVAPPEAIEEAIAQAFEHPAEGEAALVDVVAAEPPIAGASAAHDLEAPEVEEALERALALGATDVHFTPQPHAVVVRVRIDGVLRELASLPKSRQPAITSRLKVMGGVDLGTTHAPQEGRVRLERDQGTNLRLVLLPTAQGEKATLHVLSELSQPGSLTELGLTSEGEEALRRALAQPSGLVVVCGPPESGCSTTLYALLSELNTPERSLATIEDPVERVLPGVDQVAVDHAAGLSYASGLRAILLSDSDIVLVGGLPDSETAAAGVRAAVSGRLVLSCLDAPSPASTLERLFELGADRGSLAATLSCVVAQHLVQRICEDCREPYYATSPELDELGRSPEEAGRRLLARGSGCVACGGTGSRGCVAIFEVLAVTDEIRGRIANGTPGGEIVRTAVSAGMQTFRDQCVRLCLEGMTTVSELQQIAAAQPETWFTTTPDPGVDGGAD